MIFFSPFCITVDFFFNDEKNKNANGVDIWGTLYKEWVSQTISFIIYYKEIIKLKKKVFSFICTFPINVFEKFVILYEPSTRWP